VISVTVTERGRTTLTSDQRTAINETDGFWDLADAGYVSYRRSGRTTHQVVGHKYVGRALVGDLEVRVDEKASGSVLALTRAATGAELRIEKVDSPATEFDAVSQHLMREFGTAAARYVADRRTPRYRYDKASGPALAGQVDVAGTLLQQAAGRVGQFAYMAGRVVRDEPLDRVVLAGLEELDRASSVLSLDSEILYQARWLAGALEEVRDYTYLSTSRDDFLDMADAVERDQQALPADMDLARLAAVTLLHRGFEPDLPPKGTVPRAWFIDLETLFEQAVRETIRELLPHFEVNRGHGYERSMFTGGADHSRINPDIVVHQAPIVAAVGDVKYKNLRVGLGEQPDDEEVAAAGKGKRPDLYQLLVHAASLSTPLAFLIYVSDDAYVCRRLGWSATGCETWTAQVRPANLRNDVARFLGEIGILPLSPPG
jgi:McrBC 5-methylcytosine restriction system component